MAITPHEALQRVLVHREIFYDEMVDLMRQVMRGEVSPAMTAAIPEDLRRQMIGAIPVGRIGQPADIAHAIAFLCAEESSYLTGINLPVNGGLFISF